MSAEAKAKEFLATAHLYKLGDLQTEAQHPLTAHLSEWAKEDIPQALKALIEVDIQALKKFRSYFPKIKELRAAVQGTLANSHKVFFCGCGATGRLSLLTETLWRLENPGSEQVQAFMAGGDVALVHSIEGFEDFPEYGARQLRELGFTEGDLLIGPTEGGETPYVIGAIEEAARISPKNPPWMLYCNPDEILCAKVERSRRVIQNPNIKKLNLSVGPMALSGSTRMQASTVLQLACGMSLLASEGDSDWEKNLSQLSEILQSSAEVFLEKFIERESAVYRRGDFILYEVENSEITVFTDTTERAPTFSLTPFSHPKATALLQRPPSFSFVIKPAAKTSMEAWIALLKRPPRALDWEGVDSRTNTDYMMNFDFGKNGREFRQKLVAPKEQEYFYIQYDGTKLCWRLMDHEMFLDTPKNWSELWKQTLLKMLLNIHSTLVMGRMDRYRNNVMTWVFPTNGKLIDRSTRYVLALLADEGVRPSYEEAVTELFQQLQDVKPGTSVVLATVKALSDAKSS